MSYNIFAFTGLFGHVNLNNCSQLKKQYKLLTCHRFFFKTNLS